MNDLTVAISSNLSLDAVQSKQINTQPYLQPGSFAFSLVIDAEHNVTESNESNNLAYVKVILNGTCGATVPPPAPKADITSQKGVTIGGAVGGAGGKFVPWGGSVVLSSIDSFYQSNGKCAFNASYDLENEGNAATVVPFSNALRANDASVAVNSNLSLDAGQTKQINTQLYLPTGDFALILQMDTGNTVTESSETNNLVYVKATFSGTCATPAPPKADLVSKNGITIGSKFVPWGGSVVLQAADAAIRSKDKCVFSVAYDVENIGPAAAGPVFVDSIYSGSTMVGQQTVSNLNAGDTRLVTAQVAIAAGSNHLYLLLDANNNIVESNESNNASYITTVNSSCAPGTTPTTTK